MLRRIWIRDFAIVDTLELEFEPGFGALTGETGAGKSILVDALSLALGERAEASAVRIGCEKAQVTAEFSMEPDCEALHWLRASDCEGEGETILLRRVVDAGGRSRAYINGTPVTLGQLRELGSLLADIHGQHAHHSLLRADTQRALLDGFGGCSALAAQVAEDYRAWTKAREARIAAERDIEVHVREREVLEFQAQEVAALTFDRESWRETNLEHARLAHAAALIEGTAAAAEDLAEGEFSATSRIHAAASRLQTLCGYDPGLQEAVDLIEGARIQLEEAGHALRQYRAQLELDPERLRDAEARIAAVQSAARKYRVSPEELPDLLSGWQARLEELAALQDAAALAQREQHLHEAYLARAAQLGQARREVAGRLSVAVTRAMQDLAMPGGRLEIVLRPRPEGGSHGLEDVEYLVSGHQGQPLAPLARVASGGELSRIGLAIQVIAARAAGVPTLVFDEVDVGIGGGVAEVVGRLLKQLGQDRQVLCVTHLPQVAAQAHWQWSISKEGREGQVATRVRALDSRARVEEVARMLGGVNITDTSRRHAEEMLGIKMQGPKGVRSKVG